MSASLNPGEARWDAPLDANDLAAIESGACPLNINLEHLVEYRPQHPEIPKKEWEIVA